ncbi:TRAP transporter small permease [Amphritea sp.]|uniref:TRAP transporter small permease n=1 Tax=Amphritea sp. TaxID=1872502 RepID=UPI003A933DA5
MFTLLSQTKSGIAFISRQLALVGGIIMILLALMTVASIIGRAFLGITVQGDYEMVEMGLAISIFLFLTECQLHKGHVIVDFFTLNMAKRKIYFLDAVGNLMFTLIAATLAWQMYLGGLDMFEYNEQTMILELPVWIAYIPAVFSVSLLTLCCFIDTVLGFREYSRS